MSAFKSPAPSTKKGIGTYSASKYESICGGPRDIALNSSPLTRSLEKRSAAFMAHTGGSRIITSAKKDQMRTPSKR